MVSPIRFALCSVFFLAGAGAAGAVPQEPTPEPEKLMAPPGKQGYPAIRVDAVTSRGEVRLQVEIHDGDVAKALGEVASKGNLQIVAKSGVGGVLHELPLKDVSPESALRTVCQAAMLDYEVKDDVWFISPHKPSAIADAKSKVIADMTFENVKVEQLLSMISEQFDIPIAMQGNVEGKIACLHLQNKTPRQALDIIALAVDLKIQQAPDGTFIVSRNDAH